MMTELKLLESRINHLEDFIHKEVNPNFCSYNSTIKTEDNNFVTDTTIEVKRDTYEAIFRDLDLFTEYRNYSINEFIEMLINVGLDAINSVSLNRKDK